MMRGYVVAGIVVGLSLACACSPTGQANRDSTAAAVKVERLAQGSVKNLPAGKVFVNILEFRQLPGADYGPHAHIPGFVYTLHGTSTISFPHAAALSVGQGNAVFMPALVVHAHVNPDGRVGAAAIAVGLILFVILLCAATWMRGHRRRVVGAVLSLSLIAGGALPLIGASANDFYFIAVRPVAQRSQPMPRPDGRVVYTSPDLDPVPAGPYVETLSAITVPGGARYDATGARGPQMIIALQGNATVLVDGKTTQVSRGDAAFVQSGSTLAVLNPGGDNLQVLDFALTSISAASAAT